MCVHVERGKCVTGREKPFGENEMCHLKRVTEREIANKIACYSFASPLLILFSRFSVPMPVSRKCIKSKYADEQLIQLS